MEGCKGLCASGFPGTESEFTSSATVEVPSTESEERGMSRGLVWAAMEEDRNLFRVEDGSDMANGYA